VKFGKEKENNVKNKKNLSLKFGNEKKSWEIENLGKLLSFYF
jgi:hypothetical protein